MLATLVEVILQIAIIFGNISNSGNTYVGATFGNYGGWRYVTNCYFKENSCSKANEGISVSEDYMKTNDFVKDLNSNTDVWTRDDNINDGYPILKSIRYRN